MAFTNGTFETGDLTGWTNESTGEGTHSESVTVTAGAAITGTYGARFQASASDGGGSQAQAIISQEISTDFTAISFDYNPVSVVSQAGRQVFIMVTVSEQGSENPVMVYYNIIDGESSGVVHVNLPKANMNVFDWGATTTVKIGVYVMVGG